MFHMFHNKAVLNWWLSQICCSAGGLAKYTAAKAAIFLSPQPAANLAAYRYNMWLHQKKRFIFLILRLFLLNVAGSYELDVF